MYHIGKLLSYRFFRFTALFMCSKWVWKNFIKINCLFTLESFCLTISVTRSAIHSTTITALHICAVYIHLADCRSHRNFIKWWKFLHLTHHHFITCMYTSVKYLNFLNSITETKALVYAACGYVFILDMEPLERWVKGVYILFG